MKVIVACALLMVALAMPIISGGAGAHHAQPLSSSPLKGNLTGPTILPIGGKAKYVLTASGGLAQSSNGTLIGNYTYNATLIGANTSGTSVTPATGALTNGTAKLTLVLSNNSGQFVLSVNLSSNHKGSNSTHATVSININVVIPYVIAASISNHNSFTVTGALLQVNLDGSTIAMVTLPSVAANGTYAFRYNYTTSGLSSGWHTFTVVIVGVHGLLTFTNGDQQISQTFYVSPPPVDYTFYYVMGISLVALAIFISLFVVGGPRRKRGRT